MFQDPLTAVMAMLFLYFAGMLVMFIFVIRSLASQADERRESYRKQQLMMGDLERHLIDVKVMLRRLLPDKPEDEDEDHLLDDAPLSILRREDPLEAMLEAAAEGRKNETSDTGAVMPPESPGPESLGIGPDAAPMLDLSLTPSPRGGEPSATRPLSLGREDPGLPDFFSETEPEAHERKADDGRMFPPHASLGKSLPSVDARTAPAYKESGSGLPREKVRKPVNFVSLASDGEETPDAAHDISDMPLDPVPAGGLRQRQLPENGDRPLQVFSLGKNPRLRQEEALALATGPASAVMDEERPPLGAARFRPSAISGSSNGNGGAGFATEPPAPETKSAKPRLRVGGPPLSSDLDIPPGLFNLPASLASDPGTAAARADAGRAVDKGLEKPFAGMGGALLAAGASRDTARIKEAAEENSESLKRIFEDGLKADASLNLFDLEAQKEELKHTGPSADTPRDTELTLDEDGFAANVEEPVPQGFHVVQRSSRTEEAQTVAQKLPIETAGPERVSKADSISSEVQTSGTEEKILSKRVGKFSLEVKPMKFAHAPDATLAGKSAMPDAAAPLADGKPDMSPGDAAAARAPQTGNEIGETGLEGRHEVKDSVRPENLENLEDPRDHSAATRAKTGRDAASFHPREPHPMDRKAMAKRRLPGKKGRQPFSL